MRLIDADAFKEEIMKSLKACEEWQKDCSALLNTTDYYRAKQGVQTFQMCIAFLEKQPTIEDRKKGKWVKLHAGNYKCSECGDWWGNDDNRMVEDFKFCPYCGCEMER